MLSQRTLLKKVKVVGIGLHSGKRVELTLNPAPNDFGIKFKRVDIKDAPLIPANAKNVHNTENNTMIGEGRNIVHTVEHLLAVFYGFGINNVFCEINGPEVPIMDGSGASFVYLIKEAGVAHLNKSKKFMVILETVRVELEDKWAEISPASKLIIDSTIVFPHPKIKTQREIFDFSCEAFIEYISRARTFVLFKDVDMLKRKGLIKGGSLDNAIVLDDYNVMNSDGLRFENEFIRHKILDILGDLSLLEHEIAGKVTAYKSGHKLHSMLCNKLLETPSAFKVVSATSLRQDVIKTFELPVAIPLSH